MINAEIKTKLSSFVAWAITWNIWFLLLLLLRIISFEVFSWVFCGVMESLHQVPVYCPVKFYTGPTGSFLCHIFLFLFCRVSLNQSKSVKSAGTRVENIPQTILLLPYFSFLISHFGPKFNLINSTTIVHLFFCAGVLICFLLPSIIFSAIFDLYIFIFVIFGSRWFYSFSWTNEFVINLEISCHQQTRRDRARVPTRDYSCIVHFW